MLVLDRKKSEVIHIGDDIEVIVVSIGDYTVRLGINAPLTMPVHRAEVYRMIQEERHGGPGAGNRRE